MPGPTPLYNWRAEFDEALRRGENKTEMAKRLGCNPYTVFRKACALGIVFPPPSSRSPWPALLAEIVKRNESAAIAAERIGCRSQAVREAAERYGVTIRPPSPAELSERGRKANAKRHRPAFEVPAALSPEDASGAPWIAAAAPVCAAKGWRRPTTGAEARLALAVAVRSDKVLKLRPRAAGREVMRMIGAANA